MPEPFITTTTEKTNVAIAAADAPIVSGPLKSERLGQTVGIDLGSQDMALAVSRDNRMPRASVVVTTAARNIIRLSKAAEKVETIAVYGSEMDPTLHPEFKEITTNLRDLRNKWYAKAKLWLVSEDPHFEAPDVRRSLAIYDRVLVRMEWGTAKTFAAMTGRKSTEFATLAACLVNLEHLVIQARFVRGDTDNSTDAEVKGWIKRIGEMKPREVHILNADAKPGAAGSARIGKKVRLAPKSKIQEISAQVTEKTGIPVVIYTSESALG